MKSHLLNLLRTRSIVMKLMGVFILVILPLYILGILLTYYSSSQMQDEVESANKSKLFFYYNHLDFELQRMHGLVNEYAYDDTLSNFSTQIPIMSRYDIAYNLNSIFGKLKQIRETSPYIEDVIYYVPAINKRVSAMDGVRTVPPQEWQNLIGSMGNLNGALSKSGEDLYLLRSNPFSLDRESPPNFLLGIRLSSKELKSRLEDFAARGGSDITLVFGNWSNHVIFSSGEPAVDLFAKPSNIVSIEAEQNLDIYRFSANHFINYSITDKDNDFKLVASIDESVLKQPIKKYSQWMWLLTGLSVVTILIFSIWSYRVIHRPLNLLVRGFKKAEEGWTELEIPHSGKDEFGYLYFRFNEMIRRLHALIQENYVQRLRTSEAELKHLQSQITPHFLYNSLFSIKQMAEVENTELIKEFSDYLGRYFRYVTRDSAKEASLAEEVDHALVYLAIQTIRFGSRVTAEVEELNPKYSSIQVPRVLLQPIIENAFDHGLKQKSKGGILRISYDQTASDLLIKIEDNGESLTDHILLELQRKLSAPDQLQEEITGLLNVSQRMRIQFGPTYGVQVSRSSLGGLCTIIKFPWKMEEKS